jgi:hypothetical protein
LQTGEHEKPLPAKPVSQAHGCPPPPEKSPLTHDAFASHENTSSASELLQNWQWLPKNPRSHEHWFGATHAPLPSHASCPRIELLQIGSQIRLFAVVA